MNFQKITEGLKRCGYTVREFDTKEAASAYLVEATRGKTVGIGGSVTVEQMRLYDALNEAGNAVYWHWKISTGQNAAEVRRLAANAQVYISSVNGIAETGEILNIDGTGNRVSSVNYGHETVYLVVGENKIAPDLEAALYRARNIAAPRNAQRLGADTPCSARGDRCYDCNSPQRICRSLSVLWRAPGGARYEVVLIHESLGY